MTAMLIALEARGKDKERFRTLESPDESGSGAYLGRQAPVNTGRIAPVDGSRFCETLLR